MPKTPFRQRRRLNLTPNGGCPNGRCPSGRYPTNVRARLLLQPNKLSRSLFSATKQTVALDLFSNQTFILALFSNQTNVRPRFLFLPSKIRGQGQEGVGNLGGASDWASRGEVLCVIRGAPWVSDRCPRRAPGWEAPRPGRTLPITSLPKIPFRQKRRTNLTPNGRCPNGRCPTQVAPADATQQTFTLNFFSNQTSVRARSLLQLTKCSSSVSFPTKQNSRPRSGRCRKPRATSVGGRIGLGFKGGKALCYPRRPLGF